MAKDTKKNTEIPEAGPGSGEYGPINHMFPITPVELHEGWILGKERIITARSLEALWEKPSKPVVHLFDITGREVKADERFQLSPEEGRWRIRLSFGLLFGLSEEIFRMKLQGANPLDRLMVVAGSDTPSQGGSTT